MTAPYPPVDGTQPCAAEPPELFFLEGRRGRRSLNDPHEGLTTEAALAIRVCQGCRFRRPCLAYALTHPFIEGVWGATTTNEREQLRQLHGITNRTEQESAS